MTAKSDSNFEMLNGAAKPVWAQVWHLWTVIIPRRSITGRLVLVECGEGTTGATGSLRNSLSRRMTRTFIKMGAKNIIEDGAKRRAFSSL
jgi:hypothetical protein